MRVPLFLLTFSLTNLAYSGLHYTLKAQSETRDLLSAEDMMRILPGHTLLTYDATGMFWMYFPSPGTVWGRSSSGDVDIGSWWIEEGRYCRIWRRWFKGEPQCSLLASFEKDRIVWLDGQQTVHAESLIQEGNTIGPPPLLASTAAADIAVEPLAAAEIAAPQQAQVTGRSDRSGASSGGTAGGGAANGSAEGGRGGISSGGSSTADGSGSSNGGTSGASNGGTSSAGGAASSTGGGKGAKGNGAGKGGSKGGDTGDRGGKGKK
ncbi:MAG TPA: hypothetical protein VED46_06575 [Alphaproteobacteria bacterium]|nr:hypothetical protein [Alphaproteobacteria bacterium]